LEKALQQRERQGEHRRPVTPTSPGAPPSAS
jgi:hypothetical protein